MGIAFILFGCIAVALGVRGGQFYAADADAMTSFDQKVSQRKGRVICIVAGVLLIAAGVKFIFLG
jgi:hypothetical protein